MAMAYAAFQGLRRVSSGSAAELAGYLKDRPQRDILVFDEQQTI